MNQQQQQPAKERMKNSHDDEDVVHLQIYMNILLGNMKQTTTTTTSTTLLPSSKFAIENGSVKCIKFESIYQY